jgi:glycosyltransferase involved in cell wall biosynthesis
VEECIDVVHAHVSIVSPVAFGGAAAAWRFGIPTAVTFHSIVPGTPTLMAMLRTLLRTARWPVAWSAVSRLVADEVAPIAGGVDHVAIVPNAVDVDAWRPLPREGASDVIEIVTAMRLVAKKRPHVLVQTMRALVAGGANVRLTIAGEGTLRSAIEGAIDDETLSGRVRLVGAVSREELRALYARSDIFVNPALRESFGLAAVEARASGLPVVAMSRSGVAEWIEDGVHGLLADDDDHFTAQVARLVADGPLRARIRATNTAQPPDAGWDRSLAAHARLYQTARDMMP